VLWLPTKKSQTNKNKHFLAKLLQLAKKLPGYGSLIKKKIKRICFQYTIFFQWWIVPIFFSSDATLNAFKMNGKMVENENSSL
jgi:hypothetical protein